MSRFLTLSLIAAIPAFGCGISIDWDGPAVAGSGAVTTQSRPVPAFDRIDIGGEYEVLVHVGASRSVVLEGDDNLLPLIRTEVRNGTLHIESEDDLRPRDEIRIVIGVETLNAIHSGGSSDVVVRDVRSSALTPASRVPASSPRTASSAPCRRRSRARARST
jgi:hypothetical protein